MKLLPMLVSLALVLSFAAAGPAEDKPAPDPQVGQSFQIPYRLTDTNHFLVRVRINGKGPFNFLVDSGAPALYVATETAARIGLKPPAGGFWTPVDRLDFEGGARLAGVKARVEDPFQLVGMNALGLPGASIDGILGFTILARFRLQIDPTRDRMTWTRLAFTPADPPVPQHAHDQGQPPPEVQAMNVLGPLAKGLAFLMGRQPEEQRSPRGFLGLEWTQAPGEGQRTGTAPRACPVHITRVLENSPAAKAGLRAGDGLVRIAGKSVTNLEQARGALAGVRPGDVVELVVLRPEGQDPAKPGREQALKVAVGEGL